MNKLSILSFASATILLASCSNPLDKPFDRETAEADFARIVKLNKIDSSEAYIMSHFMVEHDLIGAQVLELNATYRNILEESKLFWAETGGKRVDKSDKSASANEKLTQDLKVTITPVENSVLQSEWSHGIKYHLILENASGKTIKAIKGNFVFYDTFGDKVNTIEYKYLDALEASEKVEKDITLRIQNTVSAQLILEYGKTNPFTLKWEPVSLIFN
jgi:predicted nucleic acid-binding protein